MAAHLVVHYRRRLADYAGWELWVWGLPPEAAAAHAAVAPLPGRTAFGSVFRFDLDLVFVDPPPHPEIGILPRAGQWLDSDQPDRFHRVGNLANDDPGTIPIEEHVYMVEGDPVLYTSPLMFMHRELPRFATIRLEVSAGVSGFYPWLTVHASDDSISRDVFPALPALRSKLHTSAAVLFIVDRAEFVDAMAALNLAVMTSLPGLETSKLDTDDISFVWDHVRNMHATLQMGKEGVTEGGEDAQRWVEGELAAQVAMLPALSHVVEVQDDLLESIDESTSFTDHARLFAPKVHRKRGRSILRVYYQRLLRDVEGWSLQVHCLQAPAFVPAVATEETRHQGARIFSIDLSTVPADALKGGLSITPVHGSAHGKQRETGEEISWTKEQGFDVIIAETFPYLLSPSKADAELWYHRYDDLEDWAEWELHVWTEKTDDKVAMSTMIKPKSLPRPGVVLFDLTGVLFPFGTTVWAQPVRMSMFPGVTLTNEHGEEYEGEPRRDASRRDVVRSWISGGLPSSRFHFVQSDTHICVNPPQRSGILSRRWFRLRYRRYEPDDFDGWDLWTWDNDDAESNRVAVHREPGSTTRTWADFVIDRAAYGGAASISIVPRHGGDAWDFKDEPIRVWTADLLCEQPVLGNDVRNSVDVAEAPVLENGANGIASTPIRTFIIAQGTGLILKRVEDAKCMLYAYVDSETEVVIGSPIPAEWVSPPRHTNSNVADDAVLTYMTTSASTVISKGERMSGSAQHGEPLSIRDVQRTSPTETRLVLHSSAPRMHEDFLVENVVVSMPGFEDIVLQWQLHDDWDQYLYRGELGWEYTVERCLFRCFAPTADSVSIVFYDFPTGNANRHVVRMRRIPQGCWKAVVLGDLKGKFYKLLAEGENKRLFPGVEVLDPYSRCNTGHAGRGLIFGVENTPIAPRPSIPPAETIVYELHVRDATIDADSGVMHQGKFLGLTERGTRFSPQSRTPCIIGSLNSIRKGVDKREHGDSLSRPGGNVLDGDQLEIDSTCLEHIVQMGVTAVQIMPIQDFDNDETDETAYRWGYMPVHYNSPDGWYASSVTTVVRVTEFKQLVDALHRAGLKVIMDVVYNHTAEDSNEFNLEARFSFNGLAPRYYYRTCGNTPIAHTGHSTCAVKKDYEPRCGACYSNGSGCGNEFRSEAPMGRKFLIDSLKYWANEYKVDGFRFDLLGLIDVETMACLASEMNAIDPLIVIYGEPWCGGLTPIRSTEKGMQRSLGFGVFNNSFRDAIRGSHFGVEETFVMDGGRLTEVKSGIIGSIDDFCDSPLETINYVECHDNYTLWDHMRFYVRSRTDDIKFTDNDLRRMGRLSAVIIFVSQGIPFIQMGQEMCRTKFDVENSYESPDSINMVRWETKQKEWATVQYYRGLILLRRSHPELFAMESSDQVRKAIIFFEDLALSVPERCIAYRIEGSIESGLARLKRDRPDAHHSVLEEEALRWSAVVVLLNPTPSEVDFVLPEADVDQIWIQVVNATIAGVKRIRGPAIGHITVAGRSAAVLRRASEAERDEFALEIRLACISDSYATFCGDNLLSRYSVSLGNQTAEEVAAQAEMALRRKRFEATRDQRPGAREQSPFYPGPRMSEDRAIQLLDNQYGKAS